VASGSTRRTWAPLAGVARFSSCPAHAETNVAELPQVPKNLERWLANTSKPITEAKCLHPAFYVDEQYSQVEAERVFGMNWFCVGHTAEIPSAGDVKVVDIGSTSFILTRDKSGRINAFHNTCRHRGAKLCSKSTSNCKQLVCPYHWWAYRLDGTLKSTPPVFTPKERKEDLSLRRVPGLEVFAGMIFINQVPNPPPLSDCLGDLPEKLQRYDLDDLEYHGQTDYEIKGDWKLVAENFVDYYHINAVHPVLAQFSRMDDHQPYQGQGQYIGFATTPLTDCGGPGDSFHFNHFPRVTAPEKEAALFFQIFPNVGVTIYPHSVYTLITLPGDTPGTCKEQLSLLMAPGAKKAGEDEATYLSKKQALMDFVKVVNDEDVHAIENVQQGLKIAKKSNTVGEFEVKYDWGVHRFQNMVINALHGKPLDTSFMPNLQSEFDQRMAMVAMRGGSMGLA